MNDDDDDDDNNIKRRRIYEIFIWMKDPFTRTTTRIYPKNTPLKLIQTTNQIYKKRGTAYKPTERLII